MKSCLFDLSGQPVTFAYGGRGRRVSPAAGPWPAGDSRTEESQGPQRQSVYSRSVRPLRTRPTATVTITAHTMIPAEGPDGSGRGSGLDAGGAAPHNARLPLPDATTETSQLCHRVARQPPGALAERSGSERIAGCSGGASGPCRPGLKTYRKSSPTRAGTERAQSGHKTRTS